MSPEIPDIVLVKPPMAEDKFERSDDKLSISLDTKLDIADIVSAHEHSHEIPEIEAERLWMSLETALDNPEMTTDKLERSPDKADILEEHEHPGKSDIILDKASRLTETMLDMLMTSPDTT